MQKIISINKNVRLSSGTSLVGYFEATFWAVMEKLGNPLEGCDKTTCEWVIEFEDGLVATIYDYKASQSPMYSPDVPYQWHIGGHKGEAAERVGVCLGVEIA